MSVLGMLILNNHCFLFRAERQSAASADRKGGRGKRPDIMFLVKKQEKLYELIFVECSRLVCPDSKKVEDKAKLWRETNDGMAFVRKSCTPEDSFATLGIQVAGFFYTLTVNS
jgi:hypothetical protein